MMTNICKPNASIDLRNTARWPAIVGRLVLVSLMCMPAMAIGQQKNFATPEEAVDALVAALKANDDTALLAVFGDKHKNLIVTPDRASSTETRAKIVAAMQVYRRLDATNPNRRILLIGDHAWPMPIPIVRVNDRWSFATDEGAEELINRRIGFNERNAIYVLHAYLDAQKAYAARPRGGDPVLQYAQRLGSTKGKQDGLYWPADAAKGEEASPFGPLVAEAGPYLKNHAAGSPYLGYHFKVLTRQGKNALGGPYSYVINGRMIAGFAMVAYPAAYGDTGVMTFIVSHAGQIYQKDLGKNSTSLGAAMTTFDPGPGWQKVDASGQP
jgi:hypothetical protein